MTLNWQRMWHWVHSFVGWNACHAKSSWPYTLSFKRGTICTTWSLSLQQSCRAELKNILAWSLVQFYSLHNGNQKHNCWHISSCCMLKVQNCTAQKHDWLTITFFSWTTVYLSLCGLCCSFCIQVHLWKTIWSCRKRSSVSFMKEIWITSFSGLNCLTLYGDVFSTQQQLQMQTERSINAVRTSSMATQTMTSGQQLIETRLPLPMRQCGPAQFKILVRCSARMPLLLLRSTSVTARIMIAHSGASAVRGTTLTVPMSSSPGLLGNPVFFSWLPAVRPIGAGTQTAAGKSLRMRSIIIMILMMLIVLQ